MTSDDGVTLVLDGPAPAGQEVTMALRPEAIRIGPQSDGAIANQAHAIVEQIVYHGLNTHYHLRRPSGQQLLAVRQNDHGRLPFQIEAGSEVPVSWQASSNRVVLEEVV